MYFILWMADKILANPRMAMAQIDVPNPFDKNCTRLGALLEWLRDDKSSIFRILYSERTTDGEKVTEGTQCIVYAMEKMPDGKIKPMIYTTDGREMQLDSFPDQETAWDIYRQVIAKYAGTEIPEDVMSLEEVCEELHRKPQQDYEEDDEEDEDMTPVEEEEWRREMEERERELEEDNRRKDEIVKASGLSEEYLCKLHDASFQNWRLVHDTKHLCGCFSCGKIFPASEITFWAGDEPPTAVCPYCDIDSVITRELPDGTTVDITPELLRVMEARYF